MRGAQNKTVLSALQERIIPAYAGSTYGKPRAVTHAKDHPRVCGEHQFDALKVEPRMGSSPRMRGAQPATLHLIPFDRIIPAYAGSTDWFIILPVPMGSSPRMRGAPIRYAAIRHCRRIIPAYAGSTSV